jgi:hypothetical protein
MPLDQARQILGVESAAKAGSLTRELVLEQFTRHYEANDVEKGGSFYIQSKVWNAKEVLLEELKKKVGGCCSYDSIVFPRICKFRLLAAIEACVGGYIVFGSRWRWGGLHECLVPGSILVAAGNFECAGP